MVKLHVVLRPGNTSKVRDWDLKILGDKWKIFKFWLLLVWMTTTFRTLNANFLLCFSYLHFTRCHTNFFHGIQCSLSCDGIYKKLAPLARFGIFSTLNIILSSGFDSRLGLVCGWPELSVRGNGTPGKSCDHQEKSSTAMVGREPSSKSKYKEPSFESKLNQKFLSPLMNHQVHLFNDHSKVANSQKRTWVESP